MLVEVQPRARLNGAVSDFIRSVYVETFGKSRLKCVYSPNLYIGGVTPSLATEWFSFTLKRKEWWSRLTIRLRVPLDVGQFLHPTICRGQARSLPWMGSEVQFLPSIQSNNNNFIKLLWWLPTWVGSLISWVVWPIKQAVLCTHIRRGGLLIGVSRSFWLWNKQFYWHSKIFVVIL